MSPEEAIFFTAQRFPFKDYMTPGLGPNGEYLSITNSVIRYLKPRNKILDFGCGPCDKTAILQFLEFECYGYDDLQDDWQKLPGNTEKILSFAKECGIEFMIAKENKLPYQKNFFDMVMLIAVIEHLHSSPRDLLNNLLELVKDEGILFITVPNAVNIRKQLMYFSEKLIFRVLRVFSGIPVLGEDMFESMLKTIL